MKEMKRVNRQQGGRTYEIIVQFENKLGQNVPCMVLYKVNVFVSIRNQDGQVIYKMYVVCVDRKPKMSTTIVEHTLQFNIETNVKRSKMATTTTEHILQFNIEIYVQKSKMATTTAEHILQFNIETYVQKSKMATTTTKHTLQFNIEIYVKISKVIFLKNQI